jgi:branched-chain amino acid transport system ATP-binding protein
MLEVREVFAGYGLANVLHGISLKIEAGEIVCLIGPNGAGKTTLMRVLAGMLRPSRGAIDFDGTSTQLLAPERIVQLGLSLVPEGRRVFAPLTVADNLQLGAYLRLRRGDRAAVAQDMDYVLSVFPRLRERATQLAGTLSGGEQQMLAIGRALMARPKLLLLDEPSMGLAPMVVSEIFRVIGRLHESGTTILIAEQNARMALRVAGRAYILEAGEIVRTAPAKALLADSAVAESYFGGAL